MRVPYSANIDRSNPTCFVFLIDKSESMLGHYAGAAGQSKSEALAYQMNILLQELIVRCGGEVIRDYFHVAVIGYGNSINSVFDGLKPLSEIEALARKVDQSDPLTGDKYMSPAWIDPIANGMTPMCAALDIAHGLVKEWVRGHPECFPPIVINLTDGEPSDGDPVANAQRLMKVASTDGGVLVFNGHLSADASSPIEFPVLADELPKNNPYAHQLFEMSSVVPESMQAMAAALEIRIRPGARGMVFNSDLVMVAKLLDVGTTMAI